MGPPGTVDVPSYNCPFANSIIIPTPSACAFSFLSIPAFQSVSNGMETAAHPRGEMVVAINAFRKAPNPMLLFA